MNQLWWCNIKKVVKFGVEVKFGICDDLVCFYKVYLEIVECDGFIGCLLEYFEYMWDVFNVEEEGCMKVFFVEYEGDVVVVIIFVIVGEYVWYFYGVLIMVKWEVCGLNVIQWVMICIVNEVRCVVYDMCGIVVGVGVNDFEIGFIQFKVGSGGQVVVILGEWDKFINLIFYKVFDFYMK